VEEESQVGSRLMRGGDSEQHGEERL
jgi:hypothetical protein